MPVFKGTMNITPHECYLALLEQSVAEIKQKTGNDVTVEDLEKGYKYKVKKKVGKDIKEASVSFGKTVADRRISVHYLIDSDSYEMNYDIKKLADDRVELTYSQIMKNEKPLNFIEKFIFERRLKKWLKLIEKDRIKRRTSSEKEENS